MERLELLQFKCNQSLPRCNRVLSVLDRFSIALALGSRIVKGKMEASLLQAIGGCVGVEDDDKKNKSTIFNSMFTCIKFNEIRV